MRFVLKMVFWGFVGLMVLPMFAADDLRTATEPVAVVDPEGNSYSADGSMLQLASSVVGDVQGMCLRNPEVCIQGARVIDGALVRAEHGLRVAHAMIMQRKAQRQEVLLEDAPTR